MSKISLVFLILLLNILGSCSNQNKNITPNQFEGSDTQRIQSAIDAAEGTTNKIFISSRNPDGPEI